MILVHVGQCGNQISQDFWSLLSPPPSPPSTVSTDPGREGEDGKLTAGSRQVGRGGSVKQYHPLFHSDGYARAILVDSEPKVVRKALPSNKNAQGKFRRLNVINEQSGRGNNWALGYFGPKRKEGNEGSLVAKSLESFRREAERCDSFEGSFLWSSLSGGTGSGLGSRMVAEIRSEYPKRCILTASVAPFSRGELPLQHYNSVFSAAVCHEHADGMIIFRNDDVVSMLLQNYSSKQKEEDGEQPQIGFKDINRYISRCLFDLISPTKSFRKRPKSVARFLSKFPGSVDSSSSSGAARGKSLRQNGHYQLRGFNMRDFTSNVCPFSDAKLVELWSSAGIKWRSNRTSTHALEWFSNTSNLLSRIPRYDKDEKGVACLSYQMHLRGLNQPSLVERDRIMKKTTDKLGCVQWNPFPGDIKQTKMPNLHSQPHRASISLAANRTLLPKYLSAVKQKAEIMFDAGAFKHWYLKHGAEEEDFLDAFESVDGIVSAYKELSIRTR